jgi:hypothetical protein
MTVPMCSAVVSRAFGGSFQPICPSVICDAGFFDNRYANTTPLIFHNSEKLGKGLDLGLRDNN